MRLSVHDNQPGACLIKGNIGRRGTRIYHVPRAGSITLAPGSIRARESGGSVPPPAAPGGRETASTPSGVIDDEDERPELSNAKKRLEKNRRRYSYAEYVIEGSRRTS